MGRKAVLTTTAPFETLKRNKNCFKPETLTCVFLDVNPILSRWKYIQ